MNQELNFHVSDSGDVSADSPLVCPACGGSSLHQRTLTSFYREQEDGPTRAIALDGLNVKLDANNNDGRNPSYRRDGLTIRMKCEGCASVLDFAIWQHKGSTYLGWSNVEADPAL